MTALVGTSAALSARGIVRRWGDSEVLRGVDIALEPGSRAFLGGRNGAGKTTLLRICAGLVAPHAGEVRLGGLHPVRDRRAFQSRLGYLPAGNGGLYARLTVRQNLEFWASLALLSGSRRTAAVDGALAAFELEGMERSRVDRISMGQRQRVRLAMTFIHEPSVVLLDEPHTSLDDEALALLRGALDLHGDRGGSAIWCAPGSAQAGIDTDVSFWIEDGLVRTE
jgi:heme ABC exporter ATP-binding subunit CcmA